METMEPMIEVFILEELFNDECKCESTHLESTCSHTVTHRTFSACGVYPPRLVCLNSAKVGLDRMKLQYGVCAGCYQKASVCWTITPI